jgi:hypothetical protein
MSSPSYGRRSLGFAQTPPPWPAPRRSAQAPRTIARTSSRLLKQRPRVDRVVHGHHAPVRFGLADAFMSMRRPELIAQVLQTLLLVLIRVADGVT